jgi:hypothetical protein
MVRRIENYAMASLNVMTPNQRAYVKASKEMIRILNYIESGLEFEVGFNVMSEEYKQREAETVAQANALLSKINRAVTL